MDERQKKAQLTEVIELCKTGHGPDGVLFVRNVQAAPEPMYILASDRQLQELERDSAIFVPMGNDQTLQFFVTPIVFPLRNC